MLMEKNPTLSLPNTHHDLVLAGLVHPISISPSMFLMLQRLDLTPRSRPLPQWVIPAVRLVRSLSFTLSTSTSVFRKQLTSCFALHSNMTHVVQEVRV